MVSVETPVIVEPCRADWDAMSGDSRSRHCAHCELRVINLSELTRHEAAAVLRRPADGRLCVRYSHDGAGRLLTRSDPQERLLTVLRGLAERGEAAP